MGIVFKGDLGDVGSPRHASCQRQNFFDRDMQPVALESLDLARLLVDAGLFQPVQCIEQSRIGGVDPITQDVEIPKVIFAIASSTEFDSRKHMDTSVSPVGLGVGNAEYAIMVGHRQYANAQRRRFSYQLLGRVGAV